MKIINAEKTDQEGYNVHYKDNLSSLASFENASDYRIAYESTRIGPFYKSGNTKGYVRGQALKFLLDAARESGTPFDEITVLDAGSGQGELSVYLASCGLRVIGVDISVEAKACSELLADRIGVADRCTFLAESLETTSIDDLSIDYVIGHASLHHFIKYSGVPMELNRVMKVGAKGYFADSFGENRLYHIFHNKELMQRLGDVTLTKNLIEAYFKDFDLKLTPTDWFVMLDKIYLKLLPGKANSIVKRLSTIHYKIDRLLPPSSRVALYMSGSVLTEIKKR